VVLGMEPNVSHILDKLSPTGYNPDPRKFSLFLKIIFIRIYSL
jgi:hypothetical protein